MLKRYMIAVMMAFGLSGCITSPTPFQPVVAAAPTGQAILDGTIRNPADWGEAPRRVAAAPIPRPRKDEPPELVGSIHHEAGEEVVFSDAWWAKENQENERLKRVMNICRGC